MSEFPDTEKMTIAELLQTVRDSPTNDVVNVLRGMAMECHTIHLRPEFIDVCRIALRRKSNRVYWLACTVLGYFCGHSSQELFDIVAEEAPRAGDDRRTALGKCILEHLLEERFDETISRLETIPTGPLRNAMLDTLARCWPFGGAATPANWRRVEELVRSIPELARRTDLSFLLNPPPSNGDGAPN
jgi:hypothetical protein